MPLCKTFPKKQKQKNLLRKNWSKSKNHKHAAIPNKLRKTNDGAMFRANSEKENNQTPQSR